VTGEDGRGARSGAWGVTAGVCAAAAIATWQVAIAPNSGFPILPTYILGIIAAAALYMCFATIGCWWPGRPRVPLSDALLVALNHQRSLCEAARRPFFTPDLLLALLMPGGRVAQCFDQVEPGWSGQVRSQLQSYTSALASGTLDGFRPFDWPERRDVRKAQRRAGRSRSPAVGDVHMLLGVLDTRSKTRQQLKVRFGDRVGPLRQAALRVARKAPVGPTPYSQDIFRRPG
jgi:hypothetical protein